ncbi:hypothetical protein ASPWEDRAFT_32090 [Aspergillus wentii DTO 134E9]|uniref:Zn(2)-C6 fungal-type domain-containing protein n=1 Tax=Aspergillus wentii DTO 134E9 TaxID=1073089 RepID=A0A1L9R999_ASPWE|nr:uncharacterized protein ASPWEDRAFT_32090 [Aspergillus wentii DTO 134E9]OJJ31458.1 hypothetical protein ASPWEDRAFT_32090 [Aspergillus wentii DTO 134E9]
MAQSDSAGGSETRPPQKHYRRPRRRPAYLRTKTGCLTCRQRKKKCDETRFICQNCSRGSLSCVWPEANGTGRSRPQFSPDEGSSTEPSSTSSPDSVSVDGHSNEDMTLAVRESPEYRPSLDECDFTMTPLSDDDLSLSIYTPSTLYSPAITPDSILLFDFLQMVFLRQLIRPMAHESVIERFNAEGLKLAFQTPYFMHALLACCGAEIPVETPHHYRRIGETHYAKAVAGLRADLAAGDLQYKLTTMLRAVIILCIYERSKPRLSRGVDVHLLGAAQLIQLYFHRDSFRPSSSQTEAVTQRLILEAFIFHTATSIPFQPATNSALIDSAFSLAEYNLEAFFHPETPLHAGSPVLGVPPRLFGYIREVALMYREYPVEGVNVIRCCELEYTLRQWDKETVTKCLSYGEMDTQNLLDPILSFNTPTNSPNALLLGPRLYVLAARILLNRMTSSESHTKNTNTNPCYRALVSEAMNLASQLQPSSDYFAEYYGWPFFVLGISVTQKSDRDCLMSQIWAFWEATRNGTMRRLVDMLLDYWRTGVYNGVIDCMG